MDDLRWNHVPPFGSWDCNNDLPFTQCFESAREAGFFRYSYSKDRDLYVAGDLYENQILTPAMIVVPRRRVKGRYPDGKKTKKDAWVVCEVKEPPSPVSPATPPTPPRKAPKAVDEDLYKISPSVLYAKPGRKRGCGFFSGCLIPSCAS